jgi:phage terminase small subunit
MNEKQERFLAALKKQFGNVKAACNAAAIARSTYYEWLKNEEFATAANDVLEGLIDDTESKMHELINGVIVEKEDREGGTNIYQKPPDGYMIQFFLKTKGKHRGYVEKVETENKTENLTKIVVDYGS